MPACWPSTHGQPDDGGEHREGHQRLEVRHPRPGRGSAPRQRRPRAGQPGRAAPSPAPARAKIASACAAGSVAASAQRRAHEGRRAGRGHGHGQHAGEHGVRHRVARAQARPSDARQHRAELEDPGQVQPDQREQGRQRRHEQPGDCSWKPQPSCSPPARSASSSAASARKLSHHADRVGQARRRSRAALAARARQSPAP
jgi:hypothetical protein